MFEHTIQRATRVSKMGYFYRRKAIETFSQFSDHQRAVWNDRFEEIAELESDLEVFIKPASEDMKNLQEDAIGQLSFRDPIFKSLNTAPFVLLLIALFKVWTVPTMAILTPLIAWVLPYIILKLMYKLPISQEQYGEIMKMLWSGNPFKFKMGGGGIMKADTPSFWTTRSILQTGLMVFSFLQGLIQPLQNAYHLYKTDTTLVNNGKKVIRLMELYNSFESDCEKEFLHLQFRSSLDDIPPNDPRMAIHILLEEVERFEIAMRDLAELELLWRMSNYPRLRLAEIIEKGTHPLFQAAGLIDLSLGSNAVSSDISFTGESHHAALTGPNGGGKSSFLRATLQAVLLAQAYGVAPAERLVLRRFSWVSSGLRLQDTPGNMSMFETEVWFAAKVLKRSSASGPGLVLFDELFHSTNPPDGIRTAERFLKALWERDNVVSIVSTHVFSLVEGAPDAIQRVCCDAIEKDEVIKYNYRLKNGICKVSSVKSIWDKYGLEGGQRVETPVSKPIPQKENE